MYTLLGGLLLDAPRLPILNETIRALHFHVTMWFGMILMLLVAAWYSVKYLRSNDLKHDDIALEFTNAAILFGVLGIATGMLWAKFTWGAFWTPDPKLNGTAITILIYLAYFVLRGSVDDPEKRLRLSATYNIFAFVLMLVFIMVLPRLTDSLHPGNGGNPAFGAYDLDNTMRLVFYPAVVGWILVGFWMARLRARLENLRQPLDLH